MTRIIRAAMTETTNAYAGMPDDHTDLDSLADKLDDIRQANVDHHVDLAKKAKEQGAQVIGFGEAFTGPYFALDKNPMWHALAEPLDGPTAAQLKATAKELGMVIVAPIYEYDAERDQRFNTALVIDADGELLGHYSKTHIPCGENEQGEFVEPFYFDRSIGRANLHEKNISTNRYFPVFETAVGKVGVGICYDRHFPGVMSSLAQQGAELVFSPAVTFGDKSERMWEMEFLVDAARHRLCIGGSNRKGTEKPWTQPYFGNSYFATPEGKAKNVSTDERLIIADLDLDALQHDSSGWDLPRDGRADIYDAPKV